MGMIKLRDIDTAATNFSRERYVHEAVLQVRSLLRLHSQLMTWMVGSHLGNHEADNVAMLRSDAS